MKTHWMSFIDPNKPKGEKFLGVIIIDAADFLHAIAISNLLKINPGGEIQSIEIDYPNIIKSEWKSRLLSKQEAEYVDRQLMEKWKKIN